MARQRRADPVDAPPEPPVFDAADVVLTEYKALKDEQTKRMALRDGLPYVALGAAIAGLGVSARFGPQVLLALPAAAVVLGWTYLANDLKVSEIGRYIRTELATYVAEHSPAGTLAFGWENFYRAGRHRAWKACQLLVDLTAFCVTGAAALAGYWVHAPAEPLTVAVTVVESVMVAGLAAQIVWHAPIRRAAS